MSNRIFYLPLFFLCWTCLLCNNNNQSFKAQQVSKAKVVLSDSTKQNPQTTINTESCKSTKYIVENIVRYLTLGVHDEGIDFDYMLDSLPPECINVIIENTIDSLGYLNQWLFYSVSRGKPVPLTSETRLKALFQKEKLPCQRVLWCVMFKYFQMDSCYTFDECKMAFQSCSFLREYYIKETYTRKDIENIYRKCTDKFGY